MPVPQSSVLNPQSSFFLADRKVFLSGNYREEQRRLTAGDQAKVEEKPEVRKAGLTAVGAEAILML